MADLAKLVDELSALTVMEAADLSKMLEEKWGVSAAAAVAVAAGGFQEFVTGVFHVVLIVGIIDHALQVTFVVPYFHLYFKCVIFHGYKPNDSLIRIILIRFLGCDFSVMVHVLHRRSAL